MAEEQKHVDMQLAFRSEGQFINAYLEKRGTDPFIYLIGSLRVSMATPLIRRIWENLMAMSVGSFAERLSGRPAEFTNLHTVPAGGSA